jgi:hypothetical protein
MRTVRVAFHRRFSGKTRRKAALSSVINVIPVAAEECAMLGPVQFVMIGLGDSQVPGALRERIEELNASPVVDVIDVLLMHKDRRGNLQTEPVADLNLEHSHEPGTIITSLMSKGGVARTMGERSAGGAHPTSGEVLPDPRTAVPEGSHVLAALLEHRWMSELRQTAGEVGTYPILNGWIGRDVLKSLGVLSQESR